MSATIGEIISVVSLSAVKHTLGGVPMAATLGFSYLEVAIYTTIGGIIGVAAFLFLEEFLQRMIQRFFPRKKPKKVFTRRNRMIVRVKRSFGLAGISFLTPAVLSIPVGTIVAASIYRDHKRVFLYHSISVVVWSFAAAGLFQPIAEWIRG